MAYIGMACTVMAYIVMACTVMACIVGMYEGVDDVFGHFVCDALFTLFSTMLHHDWSTSGHDRSTSGHDWPTSGIADSERLSGYNAVRWQVCIDTWLERVFQNPRKCTWVTRGSARVFGYVF